MIFGEKELKKAVLKPDTKYVEKSIIDSARLKNNTGCPIICILHYA